MIKEKVLFKPGRMEGTMLARIRVQAVSNSAFTIYKKKRKKRNFADKYLLYQYGSSVTFHWEKKEYVFYNKA